MRESVCVCVCVCVCVRAYVVAVQCILSAKNQVGKHHTCVVPPGLWLKGIN